MNGPETCSCDNLLNKEQLTLSCIKTLNSCSWNVARINLWRNGKVVGELCAGAGAGTMDEMTAAKVAALMLLMVTADLN